MSVAALLAEEAAALESGGGEAAPAQGGGSASLRAAATVMAVHVWAPCHSLPGMAYLHSQRIELLQFDCSPPAAAAWARAQLAGAPSSPSPAAAAATVSPGDAPLALHTAWQQPREREWDLQERESDLWRRHPLRLLQLVYGPSPPTGAEAAEAALARVHVGPACVPMPSPSTAAAAVPWLAPTASTFAVAPVGFRSLPTHVVIFDVDARRPAIDAFLRARGFTLARRLFHAHVRGDAHAADGPDGEPRELLVFVRARPARPRGAHAHATCIFGSGPKA